MAIFYSTGHTDALVHAIRLLHDAGVEFVPCPDRNVTHLLLPVPSFDADGRIKGGGAIDALLWQLTEDVTVIGGGLGLPELHGYKTIDLLEEDEYVSANAAITACCAIRVAAGQLPVMWKGCPVLVLGWGRIGKCLAQLLHRMEADVTVAARKASDRAMLRALGCKAAPIEGIDTRQYRVIFNTAPTMLLPKCPGRAVKVDLASVRGMGGEDVIWARGLPGKYAPESAGALIAQRVLARLEKEGAL